MSILVLFVLRLKINKTELLFQFSPVHAPSETQSPGALGTKDRHHYPAVQTLVQSQENTLPGNARHNVKYASLHTSSETGTQA